MTMSDVSTLVEMYPQSLHDSLPAVLYRVGQDPFDAYDPDNPWSSACREALTERLIPRQRSLRRRWLHSVITEGPGDLAKPPHERPGLTLACRISTCLSGGLLLDSLDAVGTDAVQRAVVVAWLAESAGTRLTPVPELTDEPHLELDRVGTVTVGHLGVRRPGVPASRDEVHLHVKQLNRESLAAVPRAEMHRWDTDSTTFKEAVEATPWQPRMHGGIRETILESSLEPDLSASAAQVAIARLIAAGADTQRIVQALNLLGFVNASGNRVWYRELLPTTDR